MRVAQVCHLLELLVIGDEFLYIRLVDLIIAGCCQQSRRFLLPLSGDSNGGVPSGKRPLGEISWEPLLTGILSVLTVGGNATKIVRAISLLVQTV